MDNLYTRKESFLVVLDSRNATGFNNGSMNSDLTYDLSDEIRLEKDTIQMSMVVSSFTCPVSFYNINSTNNILNMSHDLTYTSHIIPDGNYNASSFLAYLNSTLSPITISLSPITNKLYTSTNTVAGTAGNYTLNLPFCVNFSGLSSLNIHIDNIRTRNIDSLDLTVSNIAASVPVNASPNGVIYYEKKDDFNIIVRESTIDFDISLKDDLGNLLDLNNQHYNLVLQFDIISDVQRFNDGFHKVLENAYL
jgi:hypothetical protein